MRIGLVLFLIIGLTGCARFRIHRTSQPGSVESVNESVQHTIAFGFHSLSQSTSIKDICKENWEEIEVDVQFSRALLHFVTLNLYAPWNVAVTCTQPKPKPKDFFSN